MVMNESSGNRTAEGCGHGIYVENEDEGEPHDQLNLCPHLIKSPHQMEIPTYSRFRCQVQSTVISQKSQPMSSWPGAS